MAACACNVSEWKGVADRPALLNGKGLPTDQHFEPGELGIAATVGHHFLFQIAKYSSQHCWLEADSRIFSQRNSTVYKNHTRSQVCHQQCTHHAPSLVHWQCLCYLASNPKALQHSTACSNQMHNSLGGKATEDPDQNQTRKERTTTLSKPPLLPLLLLVSRLLRLPSMT